MTNKISSKIKQLELSLWNQNQRLANSFSTKDRNEVIKTTLKIMALKSIISEQTTN